MGSGDTISNFYQFIVFSIVMIILFILYYSAKDSNRLKKIFGIYGLILSAIYLTWRLFFTLPSINTYDIIFGVALLFFEFLAFGQNIVLRLLFTTEEELEVNEDISFEEPPTIDVIVSTYNESQDILKRTIMSCKNINHPQEKINIYIGDDGRRQSIEQLADELDVHYVTRNENAHAKAGNINNVLKQANGEYVLLLDADMIPKDTIIEKMLPYFKDQQTGFVQAPQVFYNLDPFQYNLNIGSKVPNEQDFFMRIMQEKRAKFNAVLHVGTNALFRREAIDDIGGIPTGSITEDMATGMLLQNAGYKSFFVKETLAVGLTVENFEDLIKQRDRWCRGNIQVIKKFNPLKMENLNWKQKLIYLDGLVYWMFGLQKMVYILAPLMFLLFRTLIFTADGLNLALMFLPHFISTSLFFKLITNKERNTMWSHIYDTAMAPKLALSFFSEFVLNKELKFNVTPKGTTQTKDTFKKRLAAVHIILFALSIVALIYNVPIVLTGKSGVYLSGIIVNIIWCVYNILAIFIAIFLSLEKRRHRQTERIPIKLKTQASLLNQNEEPMIRNGMIRDISENGANLKLKENPIYAIEKGQKISLDIHDVGTIDGTIVRVEKKDSFYLVGIQFQTIGFEEFNAINKYRFDLRNRYIHVSKINHDVDSIFEIIFKIIRNLKISFNES